MSIVCARPGGASRLAVGTLPFDTTTAVVTHGGVARQVRPEPFKVPNLTSFGEDGAGELYAVSGAGTLYRLAG